jgi:hypothetical protein
MIGVGPRSASAPSFTSQGKNRRRNGHLLVDFLPPMRWAGRLMQPCKATRGQMLGEGFADGWRWGLTRKYLRGLRSLGLWFLQ